MEIKALKLKNKNNPNVFVVLTDCGEFELHSEPIVKHAIKKGEVADDVFNLAVAESSALIATEKATKYLANKLKTEQQIKDYLYKQGYHKSTVEAVLNKLKEYGLINDAYFAKSYIASNKNFSTNKLKQKLISFGVKQDVLSEFLLDVDDYPSCKIHAQKFLKNKEINKQTIEKLTRNLASKGYNFETIKRVFNDIKLDFE